MGTGSSPHSSQALAAARVQHGASLPPSSRPRFQGLSLSGLSKEQTACLLLGRRGMLAVWVRKTSQGEVGDLKAPFTDV